MSLWWLGPLALAGGAALSLGLIARALHAERLATEQATQRLRSLRPALAASARRAGNLGSGHQAKGRAEQGRRSH